MNEFTPDEKKIVEDSQRRLLERRKSTVIITGRNETGASTPRTVKQIAPTVAKHLTELTVNISPEASARVIQAEEEHEREQRRRRIATLWQRSNVPELHRVSREWDKGSPWYKTLDGIRGKVSRGFTFALLGPRGNGKTQIGVELIRFNCGITRTSLYETTIRVYINLKSTFSKNSRQTEADVIDYYAAPQLLVLDDYGRRGEGVHEENIFFEILDTRYRMKRDTIICSNESRSDFEAKAGESLISRINERGGIIDCAWPSFREQQPQI